MEVLVCIIIGYFIGCINPSYFIGRFKGVDIKKNGSGNAGASNALILFGKLYGAFCVFFDFTKAWFALWLAQKIFAQFEYAFAITAVSVILGHIFPFYMRFRGGKGLACFGGMVLNYDWKVFCIMLAGAVVIVLVTNYICFVPMTAAVVFPLVYGIQRSDLIGALLFLAPAAVILIKHVENLKRIKSGAEFRFSFLWNRQRELVRMNIVTDDTAEEQQSYTN